VDPDKDNNNNKENSPEYIVKIVKTTSIFTRKSQCIKLTAEKIDNLPRQLTISEGNLLCKDKTLAVGK
jgi:L-lactate utilization protein LutC